MSTRLANGVPDWVQPRRSGRAKVLPAAVHCPSCGAPGSRSIDTRAIANGRTRRRRVCETCTTRFTTIEMLEEDTETTPLVQMVRTLHQDEHDIVCRLVEMLTRKT